MSLAVPKIPWGRTDELGDLVGVLELSAVNLDAGPGVPEERLSHSFDHACLTGAGGAQEEQISHRASGRIQTGQKHLVDLDDFFDSLVLADNAAAEGGVKLSSIVAAAVRIEHSGEVRSHRVAARFLTGRCFLSFGLLLR